MGLRIRRVPLDFDWPQDEIWHGFIVPEECQRVDCSACKPEASVDGRFDCEQCGGNWGYYCWPNGARWSETPPPVGDGYQLWETTTEGSPQSPVFDDVVKLSHWCAQNVRGFGWSSKHVGNMDLHRSPPSEWEEFLTSSLRWDNNDQ